MFIINIAKFCHKTIVRFYRGGSTLQAAGLAYVTLLSLVPLLTVSLAILSVFPVFQGLGAKIQQLIFSNFVASSATIVEQHIASFMQQTGRLSVTGTVFLIVTAVLMIFSIEQAFNNIWQVAKRRNAMQAFLMYWAVLTLTPILIGAGFVLSSYFLKWQFFSTAAGLPWLKKAVLFISPYFFTFLAFTLLYVAVPNCKVKIRFAVVGAVVATLLFELAKFGFSFYITNFPTYKLLYGAVAAVPIFLLWLYISWLVVLFGAVLVHELSLVFGGTLRCEE